MTVIGIYKEQNYFEIVFCGKREDIKDGSIWIVSILVGSGFVKSNGQSRRMIKQGAIKLDVKKIDDDSMEIRVEEIDRKILQKGKRHFKKIIVRK